MQRPTRRLLANAHILSPSGRVERASILIAGDRIEAVLPRGTDDTLAGRADIDITDVGGRTVIPGFVDAHFHLSAFALKRVRCDLGGSRSAAEVAERLRAFAAAQEGEGPVVGVDWDESEWDAAEIPTRALLDSVSATRAVYARRICGHVGVVNTPLLAALDAPRSFVDAATGRITEEAVFSANRHCAPPDVALTHSIEGAIRELHALGITAIHDIVTPRTLDAYLDGVIASRAPLRIDGYLVGTIDDMMDLRARVATADPGRFRAAGIKRFADGSLGGHTAALHTPYADADTRGELLLDERQVRATLSSCAREGIACAVHAIGDRAVLSVLAAAESVGGRDALVRVEHAEVLGEAEVEAAVRVGATLVMQPNFVRNWQGETGLYQKRLGMVRWKETNPFRTLEAGGVEFVFGSDGMPPGPLFGLRGATRHPVPGQSIDIVSALRRYTELPHLAAPGPRPAGRIEAGRLADLVVLSGNPVLADTDSLAVERTLIGGDQVFRAAPARRPRNSLS